MGRRSLALVSIGTVVALAIGCSTPVPEEAHHGPIAVCPRPTPRARTIPAPWRADVALGVPPPLAPTPPPVLSTKPGITLHIRNVETEKALPEIAAKLGRGVAVIGGRSRLTIDLDGVTPRSALRTLAFCLRADYYSLPGGTLVFERWTRGRFFGAGAAAAQPVHTVLETLAPRAGALLILDDEVDGTWNGPIPDEDPPRAIAAICERMHLHAARFGGVIVVSPRPLVGGDRDLDADKEWRENLPAVKATPIATPAAVTASELIAAASDAGHIAIATEARDNARGIKATWLAVSDTPWTDLLALAERLEPLRVRRDGAGLAVTPPNAGGVLVEARQAPIVPLLFLLADYAGERITTFPLLRGVRNVSVRGGAPEDVFRAVAALEGLAVARAGDARVALLPLGARRLEILEAEPRPTELPDGRVVEWRLEAVVSSLIPGTPSAVLLGGRAYHEDDEVHAPDVTGEDSVHVVSAESARCTLRFTAANGTLDYLNLSVLPPD